jgi:aromatic ring-opening dioxygenase catalytic subunit (LigB family)
MKQPALFISHGGGPWPFVKEMQSMFVKTARWLSALPNSLPERPKAILSVSGHWEEQDFAVSTAESPPMVYDYSGFPEHTYKIKYPAPGLPALARKIRALLEESGVPCGEDSGRGFDHGTFVPLALMFPGADIPVVSMSIKSDYSPEAHLRAGRALEPLREEGVLIMGSGLTYHNMRGFGRHESMPISVSFEDWLNETVEERDPEERARRLMDWAKAPSARLAHPQEDHLLPLMVAAGAAGSDRGRREFSDEVMNVRMASYRFG